MNSLHFVAITSHLLHFVVALLAIWCCILLFRHHRQRGWILLAAIFLEPFVLLVMRAIRARPLLPYRTYGGVVDGALQVNYRIDFPVLLIVAAVGLWMLVRHARREAANNPLQATAAAPGS